jgi:xylose isomerase
MYEIVKAGGLVNGGLNFDSKTRRGSNTIEDIFFAHIAGMDAFALGLRNAVKIIEDGRIDAFVEERYASYNSGIGLDIINGTATLESLSDYALALEDDVKPESGRQEYLESIVNSVIFS